MSTETEAVTRGAAGWTLAANSTLAAALAVVVAFLVDSLGRLILGTLMDRAPVLYHNRVEFTVPGDDLALAGGAVAVIIAGVVFLSIYPASRAHDASRLAVLWLILHCFRQGFVQLALTPINSNSDLARALVTLNLPPGLDLVIGVAGGIGLLLVSLAAAPAFLSYAAHRSDIATPAKRVAFVARVALLPAVVGGLLAVPFLLPDPGNGLVQSLPLVGLFTVATLLAAPGTKNVEGPMYREERPLSWGLLATVVVFFLVFQFALSRGIPIPPDPQQFFAS
jgi:hypothetical protein